MESDAEAARIGKEVASANGPEASADEPRINPRTRRVRRVILDAAASVLLADGADQVTAARIAPIADVARTTVYRHWPDQRSLLLATIQDMVTPDFSLSNQGDLELDVRTTLKGLAMRLEQRKTRLVFSALASHAHHSETFAAAQQNFVSLLSQPMEHVLEAAVERRELPADCDCRLEAALLTAPVLHRHFMLYQDLPDDFIESLVSRWFEVHGIG